MKQIQKRKRELSPGEISAWCRELALLLHAGIHVGDGLALLAEEESDAGLKAMGNQLALRLDDGIPLSAALRETERFPDYVCSLVEVGERTGRTEESLNSLAQYYEDRARLDQHLRSALLYPAVLLLIILAVIVVLLTQVLPVFDEVYAGLGGSLTGVAGGLLSLGRALDAAMPFLCVLLGLGIAALCLFAASYSFREWVLSLWRKLRGDKGMSRKLNTARFAQAFSMGLKSGLPLEDALDLSASLLESAPAAKARCLDCQTRLEKGAPLVKAMGESGVLPRSDCRLLELGMKSGAGDSTMGQISSRLSEESEAALEEKIGQVEPTLVVTASILIGLILLSVMLPLMHIMTAIG